MPKFRAISSLLRLSSWDKSIFVFFGVVYAKMPSHAVDALWAALAFCFVASAVYIYNDFQNAEEDKRHPEKSHRPLASGQISMGVAWGLLGLCLIVGFLLGGMLSYRLLVILLTYVLINILYNHGLRSIFLLDVLCIASGFMLRVLAGTVGIGLPMAWYLVITATLLSLCIALSKRRLEIHLGLEHTRRAVLREYPPYLLNQLIILTAAACFVSYVIFLWYGQRHDFVYLIGTIPFCAYGLARFSYLAMKENRFDNPVLIFRNDYWSRINLLCFLLITIIALWT